MMDRHLETLQIEGEIALVIEYQPGVSAALDVLQGAMGLIEALDRLDHVLLSSIDTSLEPVSILNDVQHSSLKILLVRALRKVPDDAINSLDWKKWVGGLLVKGKHVLLQKLDADAPELNKAVAELAIDYKSAPTLIGYDTPKIANVRDALDGVAQARSRLTLFGGGGCKEIAYLLRKATDRLRSSVQFLDECTYVFRQFLYIESSSVIVSQDCALQLRDKAERSVFGRD